MRRAVIAGALAALVVAAAARAEEPVGSVGALEGPAEVRRAGQAAWVPLAAGEPVFLGDRVRTLAGAKAKLVFRDDSVMTLAAASELTIDEQAVAPVAASRLSLSVGTVRALVTERYRAPGARFEVETPTAVAGARGTSFVVSYDRDRDSTRVVGVFDTTRVRARTDPPGRREVYLAGGQSTDVARGKAPTRPARLERSRFDALLAATEMPAAGLRPEDELAPEEPRAPGTGPAAAPTVAPLQDGGKAFTPESAVVDQPLDQLKQPAPTPPPPQRPKPPQTGEPQPPGRGSVPPRQNPAPPSGGPNNPAAVK